MGEVVEAREDEKAEEGALRNEGVDAGLSEKMAVGGVKNHQLFAMGANPMEGAVG